MILSLDADGLRSTALRTITVMNLGAISRLSAFEPRSPVTHKLGVPGQMTSSLQSEFLLCKMRVITEPPLALFVFRFVLFFAFRAQLVAYGSAQARGGIGAQLLATATATQDVSHNCNLHHSSWQRQIPDPLSESRD